MIFYIHGFNSSARSSTGSLLAEQIGKRVVRLEWDCSKPFEANVCKLEKAILCNSDCFDVLVGTSMGGFYALALAKEFGHCCVAFNPVTEPRTQLKEMLGRQVNFSTGKEWNFTQEILDTYPDSIDIGKGIHAIAYVSKADELLKNNFEIASRHLRNCIPTSEAHRIKNFTPYLQTILRYEDVIGAVL